MRLKIGSTYQKAVTIIEKLKEGNASIFICGKSGTGKTTLSSDIIIRNLLESGVRIVVIDHRHAVSLPADLEPYVHRQDVSQKPLKLHLFGTSANPADASASFVDTVASVIRLSDGQKPLLLSLLEKVLRDSPAPNEALERLHLEIQNSRSLAAPGLEKALTPLWGQKFFENGDFEIFSGITLLELDSFPPSTQHIVEEVVFAALLREATREDFPPTFLYLDELSNFPLHQTSALGKILNEGRKYGLYCLLVAQSICNFKAGQRILLQQCKYAMYFQPADDEIRMCARFISSSGGTKLTSMLKSLQVGEFLVSGPVYVGDSDTPTTKPLVAIVSHQRMSFLPVIHRRFRCLLTPSQFSHQHRSIFFHHWMNLTVATIAMMKIPLKTMSLSQSQRMSILPCQVHLVSFPLPQYRPVKRSPSHQSKTCPHLSKLSHPSLHRTGLVLVMIIIVLHGHKRNPLIVPVWNLILATQILAPLYEKTTNASSSLQISNHKNFTSIQTSIITMKR